MKRFDKRYVYYRLVVDIFSCLFFLLVFGRDVVFDSVLWESVGDTLLWILIAVYAAMYIGFAIYNVFYYKTSGYELTRREMKCRRGVLFRKNSVLDYTKIHAINKKQNIIQKLFDIAVLTVDSGATKTTHQAEIVVIERTAVVDHLLKQLHALREGEDYSEEAEPEVLLSHTDSLYRFTSKRKMLYSAIYIVSSVLYTGAIGMVLCFVIGVGNYVLRLGLLGTVGQFLLWALLIMLLISAVSFVVCIIQSFVAYHNFTITKRDGDIEISFGLIERHTNTFSYDRIKAVKIVQGLAQRILGFATIQLEVIGYGNDSGQENASVGILVPFCKSSEVNEILSKVLPAYIPEEKQTGAVSYFPFVSWFGVISFGVTVTVALITLWNLLFFYVLENLIAIVLSAIFGTWLLIMAIALANAFLNFKTSGLAVGNHKITAYRGGFTKQTVVFQRKNLVAVEAITTPLREKAGITTLHLHLRTNAHTNVISVPIQQDTYTHLLENKLIL